MYPDRPIPGTITSQLIWREYFYCMSVNNPNYAQMKENPICLDIDWYDNDEMFEKWKQVPIVNFKVIVSVLIQLIKCNNFTVTTKRIIVVETMSQLF